jgi:hypothetical protein
MFRVIYLKNRFIGASAELGHKRGRMRKIYSPPVKVTRLVPEKYIVPKYYV